MRNIHEESLATRQRGSERTIETLLRRGPHRWVEPDLLNSFVAASGRYGAVKYRHGAHWELEFDGFLDVSAATSGTVAFILEEDYWPEKDIDLLTSVRNSSTFSAAMLTVDMDNGEVTVTWPIT